MESLSLICVILLVEVDFCLRKMAGRDVLWKSVVNVSNCPRRIGKTGIQETSLN